MDDNIWDRERFKTSPGNLKDNLKNIGTETEEPKEQSQNNRSAKFRLRARKG